MFRYMRHDIRQATRRAAWSVALGGLLAFAACDFHNIADPDAGGNDTAKEPFFFEVQANPTRQFRLEGKNGAVTVVGVLGAQSVRIAGERIVRSRSTADARDYLREVDVRVSTSNTELLVETVQPENTHGRNVEVNYEIRVPADWRVEVHNANGLATVDSLRNRVALELANGQALVRDVNGAIVITVTNGNVLLQRVFGSAEVKAVNGNVEAEVVLPLFGTCELSSVNGNIDLAIPKNTSALFSAEVTNGAIAVIDLGLQNPVSSRTSVRGQLGRGEGKVALATVNGTIRAAGF